GFQECHGWDEEQDSGHRSAEVEQPIIIAGRAADEHVLDHLLGHRRRAAIADEVGAELTRADSAKGHVVANDLKLFPIFGDRGERIVRRRRLYRVVQFDVGQLGAADDALLLLRRQRVPSVQIVEIFLHDHIAAAGERGIPSPTRAASITAWPRGFSVPSTNPRRSRSSKKRKPCTSSTAETASPRRAMICVAISKQRSIRFARIWNSRSPGVETA